MTGTDSKTHHPGQQPVPPSFNWPAVAGLLFLTGIPAIPACFIIILVILGPQAAQGFEDVINPVHFQTPAAVLIHGLAGILFFLTMPFQFSPRIRARYRNWHRISGRIAVGAGYTMALSGVWMHLVMFPTDKGIRFVGLLIMSAAMCLTLSIALWHIFRGRVSVHRIWMIRAVAITLGAVTPLFFDALLYLVFSDVERLFTFLIGIQKDYGRLIAILLNLVLAEVWIIRSNDRSGAPEQSNQPIAIKG